MDDFLKQFRDKLNRRPEPNFEINDWLDLQKQLDRQPSKRRLLPVFWWWVLAPALTLSLAANGLLFKKLQQAKQHSPVLHASQDTVYLTQLVYQTDTFVQVKIVRERVAKFAPQIPPDGLAQAGKKVFMPSPESPVEKIENGSDSAIRTSSTAPPAFQDWRNTPFLETRLSPLARATELPAVSGFDLPPAERNTRKKGRLIIPAIRPKDFSLSVSGGLIYPQNTGLDKQHGWSIGLQASIGITPCWRLWLEEQYIRTGFLSEYMGDDIGVPVVTPPSNDFIFVNAETRQPMWQTGLGLQYGFNPQKTWRPFLGAGYGIVSVAPYEVTYEFKNQVLNTEWDYDQEVRHRELLYGFLLLRAGIERRVAGPFAMNLSATYRTNFDKNTFSTPPLWGIQMGLRF